MHNMYNKYYYFKKESADDIKTKIMKEIYTGRYYLNQINYYFINDMIINLFTKKRMNEINDMYELYFPKKREK